MSFSMPNIFFLDPRVVPQGLDRNLTPRQQELKKLAARIEDYTNKFNRFFRAGQLLSIIGLGSLSCSVALSSNIPFLFLISAPVTPWIVASASIAAIACVIFAVGFCLKKASDRYYIAFIRQELRKAPEFMAFFDTRAEMARDLFVKTAQRLDTGRISIYLKYLDELLRRQLIDEPRRDIIIRDAKYAYIDAVLHDMQKSRINTAEDEFLVQQLADDLFSGQYSDLILQKNYPMLLRYIGTNELKSKHRTLTTIDQTLQSRGGDWLLDKKGQVLDLVLNSGF